MAHSPEEHFKTIVGSKWANLATELANARAATEQLSEQLQASEARVAALTEDLAALKKPERPPPEKDAAP